jgi:putative phosphoesterase
LRLQDNIITAVENLMNKFMIGVISDTHGLLRPEIISLFKDSDLIIHAGNIGNPQVLDGLNSISKVIAVRGNNDKGKWAKRLPDKDVVTVRGILIYIVHNGKELILDPKAAGVNVIISGHSHHPRVEYRQNLLFVNPGRAGPRRFNLPISVARIRVNNANVEAELIEIASNS